jgi:uncharacterized metal-binding protein YceD (DUF177 family)
MTKQVALEEAFDLGSVHGNGAEISFVASREEMSQILDIIGIVSLNRLEGDIRIKPWHKTGFMLVGELRASAAQECVVTLDPVPEEVVEPFERTFIPEAEAAREEPDEDIVVDFILEAEDPPDILTGHTINLLEIVAEHLALGLNPWPRAQGAEINAAYTITDKDIDADETAPSPFDVLKDLKH